MIESFQQGQKQWSCISSPKAKNVHCFIPKSLPDKEKVAKYKQNVNAKNSFGGSYHYNSRDQNSTRFKKATEFDIMVKNDFHHQWIKKKDYKSLQQDTKSKTSDAMDAQRFGNVSSIKKIVPDLDRSRFCERIVKGYNDPTNEKMASDCSKRLNSKIPFQDIHFPFLHRRFHK